MSYLEEDVRGVLARSAVALIHSPDAAAAAARDIGLPTSPRRAAAAAGGAATPSRRKGGGAAVVDLPAGRKGAAEYDITLPEPSAAGALMDVDVDIMDDLLAKEIEEVMAGAQVAARGAGGSSGLLAPKPSGTTSGAQRPGGSRSTGAVQQGVQGAQGVGVHVAGGGGDLGETFPEPSGALAQLLSNAMMTHSTASGGLAFGFGVGLGRGRGVSGGEGGVQEAVSEEVAGGAAAGGRAAGGEREEQRGRLGQGFAGGLFAGLDAGVGGGDFGGEMELLDRLPSSLADQYFAVPEVGPGAGLSGCRCGPSRAGVCRGLATATFPRQSPAVGPGSMCRFGMCSSASTTGVAKRE